MLENYSTEELKREIERRKAEKAAKSTAKPRYEIIGTWSGYNYNQKRIAHREYTTDMEYVKKIEELGSIYYTDGTSLDFSVRQMGYGERKKDRINSYSGLIQRCIAQGTNSVAQLR